MVNKQKESCEKRNERSDQRREKGEDEGMHNDKKKSDAHAKGELSKIEVKQERSFYAKEKDMRKALLLRQPILVLIQALMILTLFYLVLL